MQFWQILRNLSGVALGLQWAYMLAAKWYAAWGFWGGAAGLVASPALLPFAPFGAWYFFPASQAWPFYATAVAFAVAMAAVWLLTPRITSDYGR